MKAVGLAGKPEAFRKAGRQSRSERRRELAIWTALAKPYHYPPLLQGDGLPSPAC
jgi:hypothetical protein